MKTYVTETTDKVPFDVLLYTEEKGDMLFSYLLNMAEDTNETASEWKYRLLSELPKTVLASDRYITIKKEAKV